MKNTLELYNDILFVVLRPWKYGKQSDSKFKQLLLEAKKEYYKAQPNYEVDFIKPLSNIREYYHFIIESEAIRFLNNLHEEMSKALTESEKYYLIYSALTNTLTEKIKNTALIIQTRNYSLEQFDISVRTTLADMNIANESYILHYLKHQIVRLIMEVQDSFSEYMKEEMLTLDEIYSKYFNEPSPKRPFIIEAQNYPNTAKTFPIKQKETKPAFKAIQEDIRDSNKDVFSYDQLIKNKSRFAQIEEELNNKGYINENYEFSNKYGQKQFLAAFYHQLLRKNYFNKRIFPPKGRNFEIKPLYIRKFLDHRYNTNIDKQFRNWYNNEEGLLKFIEKDYWLDSIPPC